MTVFKTLVAVLDGHSLQAKLIDTIRWNDTLWLVPTWQPAKSSENRQPVRIIRPQTFAFESASLLRNGADYSLSVAIPRDILDGRWSPAADKFEVVETPPVESLPLVG